MIVAGGACSESPVGETAPVRARLRGLGGCAPWGQPVILTREIETMPLHGQGPQEPGAVSLGDELATFVISRA